MRVNGVMREHNLHGNHQAPSRDIAERFALLEHLNYMSTQSGSPERNGLRYVEVLYLQVPPIIITVLLYRCGDGLAHFLTSYEVQSYMSNAPPKILLKDNGIYQHGVLRKVQTSSLVPRLCLFQICKKQWRETREE